MAGVIDSEYRGEIKVGIFNAGKEPIKIEKGMRIAQIIIHRIKLDAEYVGEDAINETARGEKGFGSTGTK
jgi:dUTP pyrophosphatase